MQQGRHGRVDGNAVIVLQACARAPGRFASVRNGAENASSSASRISEKVLTLSYINKVDAPTDLLIHIV
jgi:hypothetical protein